MKHHDNHSTQSSHAQSRRAQSRDTQSRDAGHAWRQFSRRLGVLSFACLLGALFTVAAGAQPGERGERDPAGRVLERMTRLLELSEDQVADLEAIFSANEGAGAANRDAMRENRQALKEQLAQDVPDATAVGELVIAGKELRADAKADRADLQEQINQVLTDEQQAKWEGFQRGRRSGGDRGGRGQRGPRGFRSQASPFGQGQ